MKLEINMRIITSDDLIDRKWNYFTFENEIISQWIVSHFKLVDVIYFNILQISYKLKKPHSMLKL